MNHLRLSTSLIVSILALATRSADAAIVGPYASDANTTYLFHFDAPSGSVAANSGSAGGNLISYSANTYPGDGVAAPAVTTVLGASAFSGFGFAANMNPGNVASNFTATTANGIGLGFDANNDGSFVLDDAVPLSADRLANMNSIFNSTGSTFTLEAMVNVSTITAGNQEIIATDSASANNLRGFQFRITNTGHLEFFDIGAGAGAVGANDIISTLALSDTSLGANQFQPNTWFHTAVTFDGSNLKFYWTKVDPTDTQASLLQSVAFTAAQVDATDSEPLVIGNEGRVNGTNASQEGLLGELDEVRISSIARAPDQFIFSAAPEPGTTALLTSGALFGFIRRRRK